jgi:SM-20-related protein
MQALFDTIADRLIQDGYIILQAPIDTVLTEKLYKRIDFLKDKEFHEANIGRGEQHHNNVSIRTDKTLWLEGEEESEHKYLQWMGKLQETLNRELYLGIHNFETHFAYYEKGDFYKKHSDVLKSGNPRILTTVFYLNKNWKKGDGGELLIFGEETQEVIKTVEPTTGTMVIFLSDKFLHEVKVSNKDRYSIAGWFKGRSVL